jgi:hypothetical protein
MKKNEQYLFSTEPGQKIQIIDKEILKKFPSLKSRTLICSVVKRSGSRLFFQYFSKETGSGTLKLLSNPIVKVIEDKAGLTLANFLTKYRYENVKPTTVTVTTGGSSCEFMITPAFWNQTVTNIRLTGLTTRSSEIMGSKWRVPGSALVTKSTKK